MPSCDSSNNAAMQLRSSVVASALATVLSACVSLAPGADKVRITNNAADVSRCAAVGNIKVPTDSDGDVDIANAAREFRNQTVGLGGNIGFVTYGFIGAPVRGVAYRCP